MHDGLNFSSHSPLVLTLNVDVNNFRRPPEFIGIDLNG